MKELLEQALNRLESIAERMEALRLNDYLRDARDWRRRLKEEFLGGIVRGVGFSIGFTLLGALVLVILNRLAVLNLPVIGRALAELLQAVEQYMR